MPLRTSLQGLERPGPAALWACRTRGALQTSSPQPAGQEGAAGRRHNLQVRALLFVRFVCPVMSFKSLNVTASRFGAVFTWPQSPKPH